VSFEQTSRTMGLNNMEVTVINRWVMTQLLCRILSEKSTFTYFSLSLRPLHDLSHILLLSPFDKAQYQVTHCSYTDMAVEWFWLALHKEPHRVGVLRLKTDRHPVSDTLCFPVFTTPHERRSPEILRIGKWVCVRGFVTCPGEYFRPESTPCFCKEVPNML
jgi:hypothetical protein